MDSSSYNKYLFSKYQRFLLWFANTSIGKRYFGLATDVIKKYPITKVFPNGIAFDHGKQRTAHFYLDERLANRIGWLLEAVEVISVVDYIKTFRYLGLGTSFLFLFSVGLPLHYLFPFIMGHTSTFSPTSSGGINSGNSGTYATVHTGNNLGISGLSIANSFDSVNYTINRIFLTFDTSSLDDTAVFSSAFIRFPGTGSVSNTNTDSAIIVTNTQASNTSLATSDFGNLGSSSIGTLAFSSWSTSANNDIALSDLTGISVNSYSKYALRTSKDAATTTPTGSNTVQSTSSIILSVTYTVSSPSASVSPSASLSPSSSISRSISPSSSISPSASISPSHSISPSGSLSPSSSASASPSPGFADYTRGAYTVLPINDNDLTTVYSAAEIAATQVEDNQPTMDPESGDVGQDGELQYMVHQFKVYVGAQNPIGLEFSGESTLAPALSAVYLQIYNHHTGNWDTLDSNNYHPADVTFDLKTNNLDITNYKNASNVISVRVWQLAI